MTNDQFKAYLSRGNGKPSLCVSVLQTSVREQKKLLVENAKLKKDIEQLKTQLQEKQRRRAGTYTFHTPIQHNK